MLKKSGEYVQMFSSNSSMEYADTNVWSHIPAFSLVFSRQPLSNLRSYCLSKNTSKQVGILSKNARSLTALFIEKKVTPEMFTHKTLFGRRKGFNIFFRHTDSPPEKLPNWLLLKTTTLPLYICHLPPFFLWPNICFFTQLKCIY